METNDNTIRLAGQEETQFMDQNQNETQETGSNRLWKKVSFGTAAGILLGAGAIYAVDHTGEDLTSENSDLQDTSDGGQTQAPVAQVSDSMSFSEAFAAARSQVGAGGVFAWRGGVYGTYYETEWDAMTAEQRDAYAQSVNIEVRADRVDATQINEAHPDVAVHTPTSNSTSRQEQSETDQNVRTTSNDDHNGQAQNASSTGNNGENDRPFFEGDDDVRVISRGEVEGHEAVAVDITGNEEADAVIIDIDDSHTLSEPDVVVLRNGDVATMGEIAEAGDDGNLSASNSDPGFNTSTEDPALSQSNMENPEVAPDMPDYMDDANILV